MSLPVRLEQLCSSFAIKHLKSPFIVALFTLLLVLFLIFSTISSTSSLCDRLLVIEHYQDQNLHSGVTQMPINLTIAYISDTGMGDSTKYVYQLIQKEGAELIVHSGDLNIGSYPADFDQQLSKVLGSQFPILGVIGENDRAEWADIPGYQDYLLFRLRKTPNITCSGTIGVNYWCVYRGLYFAFSSVGTECKNHIKVLQSSLSSDIAVQFPFKICSWHKNQRSMQVSNNLDETTYDPYETCRQHGAMIVTGHNNCYARTHLLSSTINHQVQSNQSPYYLNPGNTLVVVSGLGGYALENANPSLAELPYWGATYCYNNSNYRIFGALFCKYNLNGDASRALCYFKDINGVIPDSFQVVVPDKSK